MKVKCILCNSQMRKNSHHMGIDFFCNTCDNIQISFIRGPIRLSKYNIYPTKDIPINIWGDLGDKKTYLFKIRAGGDQFCVGHLDYIRPSNLSLGEFERIQKKLNNLLNFK